MKKLALIGFCLLFFLVCFLVAKYYHPKPPEKPNDTLEYRKVPDIKLPELEWPEDNVRGKG